MAIKSNKSFADQFDDEEVMFVFRKHPIVMRRGLIYSSVALLIGPLYVFVLTRLRPVNPPSFNLFILALVLSFVLSVLIFFPFWLGWFYSVFIVTNQRLIQITQKGLFHRSIVGLGLDQIQMINYEIAGIQETLLSFGTIMIQTMVGSLTIHEVYHPAKIHKQILQILRDQGINATTGVATEAEEV